MRALGIPRRGPAWGVRTKAAPVRSGRPELRHQGSGNCRRKTRRVGAAAALERRATRREPQAVVRSTLPEAMAVVPALVTALLHGAVRTTVDGEAGTGDARSAGATSRGAVRSRRSRPRRTRREPRQARRVAPTRGANGGEDTSAVELRRERVGPATAVSEASRRASGARSDRREERTAVKTPVPLNFAANVSARQRR